MDPLFPQANAVAGILVLIVGFGFHFCGQLLSVVSWDVAARLGLQERDNPPDYYPYEHGTAVGDVLIGWVYPIAGLGLLLDTEWGLKLAWIPGSILLYHSLCAWFWERDRRAAGHGIWTDGFRFAWCGANFVTGLLTLAVAWVGHLGAM